VATSSLRDARNRDKLARRLEAAAGAPVRILSGDEEAALMFAALRAGVPLGDGRILGVDLGGGSLELAVGSGERLEWTASLELGAARLVGRFLHHDPPMAVERARMVSCVETALGSLPSGDFWPASCVAAGGTVKALARLLVASGDAAGPLNGLWLGTDTIKELSNWLLGAGLRKRRRMPGMDRHRVDMLGAGGLVLASLLGRLGLEGMTVSEWGLREGVILEALDFEPALAAS
jgi:exopolyphosphatase/guanosine-5'-triphosphate,3'-diphosphate pyrophosphatase